MPSLRVDDTMSLRSPAEGNVLQLPLGRGAPGNRTRRL